MKRTIRLLAAPAAALLLLTACSGTPEENPTTEPASAADAAVDGEQDAADDEEMADGGENLVYEQGVFTAQNDTGAQFTIEIPTEAPADVEAFREAVGEEPVGYIKIEIDNTNGTDNAGPSDVHLVDENGDQYTYTSAFSVIGDWGPTMRDDGPEDVNDGYWYELPDGTELSEEEYDELNSQGRELYNTYLEDTAMPKAKAVAYYIGPEVPEKFLYVEVQEAMMPYIAEPAA